MNRANRNRRNRTDRRSQTDRRTDDSTETTMGDVSHTHPYADHGAVNRPFQRGPIVAADGGEREAYDEEETEAYDEEETEAREGETADAREEEDEERDGDRMKDVNHTPPNGASANPVFERGGKEEPVESEE